MESIEDKIKIATIKANAEANPEKKTNLQKKVRKLLLQAQIENLQKQIEDLGV